MNTLEELFRMLPKTPDVLDAILRDLPEEVIHSNEGADTWSAFDIVGHLLHCEKHAWLNRINTLLQYGVEKPFEPFDRFIQLRENVGKDFIELLDGFRKERFHNIDVIHSMNLQSVDLDKEGMHPDLGVVKLRNLLSIWCAHDLVHIVQISRVLAKRYKHEIGPWLVNTRLLQD